MTAGQIRKLQLLDFKAIRPLFDLQLAHCSTIRTPCSLSYLLDCRSDCRHEPPFRDTEAGLEGAPPSPLMIGQQLSDRNDRNLDSEPEMGSDAAQIRNLLR